MNIDKKFLLTVALPLAEAAYGVTSETAAVPEGFEFVASVQLDEPIGRLSPDNSYFGFVAVRDDVAYIAIRGTQSLDEWLEDFDASLTSFGGYRVHAGFDRVYAGLIASIWTALKTAGTEWREICVIGHSLGAAVATLVAANVEEFARVPVSCIAFASPRVGDPAFCAKYGKKINLLRVTNTKDIVTHVPPRPIYAHAGDAVVFDGWDFAPGIEQRLDAGFEHSLENSYRPGIAAMRDCLVRTQLT